MATSFKPKYRIVHQTKKNIWKNTKVYKKFFRRKWWFIGLKSRKSRKYKSTYQQKVLILRGAHSLKYKDGIQLEKLFFKRSFIKEDLLSKRREFFFNRLKSSLKAWKWNGRYDKKRNKKSFHDFRRFKFVKKPVFSKLPFFQTSSSRKNFRKKRRLQTYKKSYYKDNLLTFQGFRKSLGKVKKRQFSRIYKTLFKSKTNKMFNFLNFLDRRFDISVSKVFLNNNIFTARQLILHGFFFINGKKCNSPSIFLKEGDMITIDPLKWSYIYSLLLNRYIRSLKYGKKIHLNNNYVISYSTLSFLIVSNSNLNLNKSTLLENLELNSMLR